ncbi:hypothetical protein OYE22_15230 [Streptomyces sp. 71268]|uniref:hypothetical protein n=1 Tax=Streptomyces sp. 71268 TaxID=3002640 RepID=UPI0023FA1DDC|nr:hypothetical protein [Streptomyces sp. 71268]WEV26400.1 hypothetical protein OYE22_15230 [Streptomyces sp. 71268]
MSTMNETGPQGRAVIPTEATRVDAPSATIISARSSLFRAHGVFTERFGNLGNNRESKVFASLTEVGSEGPFIGAANMRVFNISPVSQGLVDIRGEVEWPEDLDVIVSFLVVQQ